MPDVMQVPKCTDIVQQGSVLYDKYVGTLAPVLMEYKIGYDSPEDYEIYVGCYHEDGVDYWVFGSRTLVTSAGIKLVAPTGTALFQVDDISNGFESGYYIRAAYTITPLAGTIYVTVFASLQEVLNAFNFPVPPSPDSGVVVTAIARPIGPGPTSGVVVTATARSTDPNAQGGISQPGGGTGTFDDTSYTIPAPEAPSLTPTASGLVTLFRPSVAQITALSEYLWTNLTDFIENLNKMFVNPMDYLISLSIVPCTPDVGTERAIKIGSFTTTINMPPVLSAWYDFDCGTVKINEYWGSFLDYSPNTKISLFLPFIGAVPLDVDEVMGKTVGILYRIDLFSGQCIAMVSVDGSYRYQFAGQCSASIPMTGSDWSRVYSAAISAGVSLASGLAGGVTSLAESLDEPLAGVSRAISKVGKSTVNSAERIMGAKLSIERTGSISGCAGLMGLKTPYLLIEYPRQSLPENYAHYFGYPSNIYSSFGSLSGFTTVEQTLINIPGTDGELSELMSILKGGVYF